MSRAVANPTDFAGLAAEPTKLESKFCGSQSSFARALDSLAVDEPLENPYACHLPRKGRPSRHVAAMTSPSRTGFGRVAIVHDWCPNFRGGERVLARLCRLFPGAEVFTLFDFLPTEVKQEHFAGVHFHTSPANRLPLARRIYRHLFFACPFLIEQFDVTAYDLVLSSSAAFARGVLTRPDQPHLCYVHSPVRYAWDEQFSYLHAGRYGFGPRGLLLRYLLHRLRQWDARTAYSPDVMLANSSYVRMRIQRIYGRDAEVVHPPVDLEEFAVAADRSDHYVTASYMAPYMRTDLVIKAFNEMPRRKLVVVGEGQLSSRLRALAGPNVSFKGPLPRESYARNLASARAMVFAGCENFGIALAEAQACGTPLIAFGRGGARDIVRPLGYSRRPTGLLFERQEVSAVKEAVEHFEASRSQIRASWCRDNARRFSTERFDEQVIRNTTTLLRPRPAGWQATFNTSGRRDVGDRM